MPCCQCCCGGVTCTEGRQGKCCCGGPSGTCCQPGEYCCSGVCQATPCGQGQCLECPPNPCFVNVPIGQCCPEADESHPFYQGGGMTIDACDPAWTVTQGGEPYTELRPRDVGYIIYEEWKVFPGWEWKLTAPAPPEGFGVEILSQGACAGQNCNRLSTGFKYDVLVGDTVVVINGGGLAGACKIPGETTVTIRVYEFEHRGDGLGCKNSDICWCDPFFPTQVFYPGFTVRLLCNRCFFGNCNSYCNPLP